MEAKRRVMAKKNMWEDKKREQEKAVEELKLRLRRLEEDVEEAVQ